jgi:DNA repair protein RecN (Recombination protein N)
LDTIYRLKQKYGRGTGEILQYLEKCRNELSGIELSQERMTELKKEYDTQYKLVSELALRLSGVRRKAALLLEKRILDELSQLDMGKIEFSVSFEESKEEKRPGPDGFDEVKFLISTNLGEPLKPLSRIASGGELARIMLALKNVLAENDDVSTLIFDEVDSGVSGRAAQRVAEKLSEVAQFKQVLCVTHLPQLAAMADNHFLIEKGESGGRTVTSLTRLSYEDRLKEIARITGGLHISDISLKNAAELLDAAGLYKNGRGNKRNDLV